MLSRNLSDIQQSISTSISESANRTEDTLHWGFSELLISVGGVSDRLDELIRIARTPSQVWAYEQFEIARDEFRRRLFPESINSIKRAIEGYGSNPGFPTEFRFHFLLGTLRLGDYANCKPENLSTSEAEKEFLLAARYAEVDHPKDAGRSLICAGRAAFVQKRFREALQFTDQGLEKLGNDGSGLYQRARLLSLLGSTAESEETLARALLADTNLAIAAAGEGDFGTSIATAAISKATDSFRKEYAASAEQFDAELRAAREFRYEELAAPDLLAPQIDALARLTAAARSLAQQQRLFSLEHARAILTANRPMLDALFPSYKDAFQHRTNARIAEIERQAKEHKAVVDNQVKELVDDAGERKKSVPTPNVFGLGCVTALIWIGAICAYVALLMLLASVGIVREEEFSTRGEVSRGISWWIAMLCWIALFFGGLPTIYKWLESLAEGRASRSQQQILQEAGREARVMRDEAARETASLSERVSRERRKLDRLISCEAVSMRSADSLLRRGRAS